MSFRNPFSEAMDEFVLPEPFSVDFRKQFIEGKQSRLFTLKSILEYRIILYYSRNGAPTWFQKNEYDL